MAHDPFLAQSQDQGGPAIPQLQPGQFLFNRRYELKQLLGVGGMGVVWLARDHTEEIEVALKFLPSVLVLQEREMQRLREEVRAGKELRHPRLVGTYGMEVSGGMAAIIMEYVPGKTLQDHLETAPHGFFEPDQIADWVTDICDGLAYLHEEAHRVHRDLKPANVIVDLQGRARLMDFGISHRIKEGVTRHTKTGTVQASATSSNTLAYASPQQLDGKPSIAADDIYGLGALISELLTSTPPFFRGSAEVVAMQIRTAELTPMAVRREELLGEGIISSLGHAISQPWESCVVGCLRKDREQRFSLTQVRNCLLGTPHSPPAAARSSKTLIRVAVAAGLALVGVAALKLMPTPVQPSPSVVASPIPSSPPAKTPLVEPQANAELKQRVAEMDRQISQLAEANRSQQAETQRLKEEAEAMKRRQNSAPAEPPVARPMTATVPLQPKPTPVVSPAPDPALVRGAWLVTEVAGRGEDRYVIEWQYDFSTEGDRVIATGRKVKVNGKAPTVGESQARSTLEFRLGTEASKGVFREVNHRNEVLSGTLEVKFSQDLRSFTGSSVEDGKTPSSLSGVRP